MHTLLGPASSCPQASTALRTRAGTLLYLRRDYLQLTAPPPYQPDLTATRCGGVVVLFNPPEGWQQNLEPIRQHLAHGVVVDNSPSPLLQPPSDWEYCWMQGNAGIAAATNAGLARLRAHGCSHALLLDQDSQLAPADLHTLISALVELPPDALGVVPGLQHPLPGMHCRWPQRQSRWRFRFVYAKDLRQPTPVHVAISSGMLLNLPKLAALGDFDADLFIDLVDTDLCLRALKDGLQIYAIPGTAMPHAIGRPQPKRVLGQAAFPTHHGANRHYTLARNRILLMRRHATQAPFWAAYEWLGAAKLLLKVLLFEPGRWRKLGMMLRGSWAGLRGRSGPPPQWE